jgi:hypothetical protein
MDIWLEPTGLLRPPGPKPGGQGNQESARRRQSGVELKLFYEPNLDVMQQRESA